MSPLDLPSPSNTPGWWLFWRIDVPCVVSRCFVNGILVEREQYFYRGALSCYVLARNWFDARELACQALDLTSRYGLLRWEGPNGESYSE